MPWHDSTAAAADLKNMIVKRYILTLLAVMLTAVCGFAQLHNSIEIDEKSFAAVQTDAISGVAIDKIGKDHSQRECARIKMRINRMTAAEIGEISVRPRGGNVEVMKCVVAGEGNGLIIELTAKEPTRFYITHPKYGDSNEVSLNLVGNKEYRINAELRAFQSIVVESNIVGADVYIDEIFKGQIGDDYRLTISNISRGEHSLRVVHGAQQLNELIDVSDTSIHFRANLNTATSRPQYVVFEVVPHNAILVIDHKSYVLDSDGCTMVMLNNGTYNYQVSAKDYHDERGEFTVSGAKVDKRVELKPAFGWLSIDASGTLKDANIFVDNTLIGKTPISRSQLSSGTHHVRIVKDMYVTYEDSITISDGQELRYSASLAADFATVTITADAGSDIYVNDVLKGKSPWTGTLSTGTYIFEARKEGHRTTSLTKNIAAEPAQQSYKLDAPTPIMGTINVMCTPLKADVYVDGKMVGTTPLMHDLIIGKHKITLRKEGYADHEQTITVEEGKVTDVTATLSEHKEETYIETAKGLNLKMILVEGGTFAMGSTSGDSDERPVHNVTLDSYYIGETEITQAQWRAIMGTNPSSYTGDNRPVENVSWEDAQKFCKKLSELTGKRYVLPTEAQWEYAARGGNKSKGYTYSGSNNIDDVAKYGSSTGGHSNVKSKKPNELGIYDMSGNVWEWCSDWYGDYSSSSQTNPQGPSSGSSRVWRGGSWGNYSNDCRAANRCYSIPSGRGNYCGFRVVCLPEGSNGFNGANVTATLSEQKKAETQVQNNAKVTGATYTETVNGLNLKMILVEGGTFAMGSTSGDSDEKPVHNVTLDSYYIGETEITQAQWRAIMGSNPSSYTGDNRPVESVSWEDAQEFCKKLSALTGKKYVLPTEAQWEYAARGGNKSKGYTYSGSNNVYDVAVYYDNRGNGHSNVKSKKPNELGIYDMSGNVYEWCSDWYNESYYSSSHKTNPQGPSSGGRRVLRGGSWSVYAINCRVADRINNYPSDRYGIYGFRVVCLP